MVGFVPYGSLKIILSWRRVKALRTKDDGKDAWWMMVMCMGVVCGGREMEDVGLVNGKAFSLLRLLVRVCYKHNCT